MYFVKFLPPLPPLREGAREAEGKQVFGRIGCARCHMPSMRTGDSKTPGLGRVDAALYSDLLLHDMGDRLADHISEGSATAREFRTTPLWGLGRKKYLLHDGRARSAHEAILEHDGEAARAAARYRELPEQDRRALEVFLRSL